MFDRPWYNAERREPPCRPPGGRRPPLDDRPAPPAAGGQPADRVPEFVAVSSPYQSQPTVPMDRRCPWCGSEDIRHVQRGYTGPTDEINQYFTCFACGRVTYELIAKTAREMRLGRWHAGGIYKDTAHKTRYHVSRVLKVGVNEYLIYLKPIVGAEVAATNPEP
jgi:hypothetical protein